MAVKDPSGGNGPPAVIDKNVEQPLGVPSNYVSPRWIDGVGPVSQGGVDAARRYGATPEDRAARGNIPGRHSYYYASDAYAPASNPSDIPDLQQKLIKAGLLDPTKPGYTPGLWGALEVQAYINVLTQANIYGVDADRMLDYKVGHPGQDLNAIQQISLSSPISIQQAFESAFESSLGHKPAPDQTAAFVSAYQHYQVTGETAGAKAAAAYAKNPATAPTSITDTAAPGDFAKNYIDTQYASEEAGVGYQHGLDLIKNEISSTAHAGG